MIHEAYIQILEFNIYFKSSIQTNPLLGINSWCYNSQQFMVGKCLVFLTSEWAASKPQMTNRRCCQDSVAFASCRWALNRYFCPIHTECLQRCSTCCSAAALTGQGVMEPLQKKPFWKYRYLCKSFSSETIIGRRDFQNLTHTGIMRILQVSFQYYHIYTCLAVGFRLWMFSAKQEPLTNKDQPPSLQQAWLICLNPPTSVRGQPGPYLAC